MIFQVLELSANIYKQIPENIDYDNTAKLLSVDPSPLNVVLLQEVGGVGLGSQKVSYRHKALFHF